MKLLSDGDVSPVSGGVSIIGDFFASIFGAAAWGAAAQGVQFFGVGFAIGTGMNWVIDKMEETGQGFFQSTDNPFLDSVVGGNLGS